MVPVQQLDHTAQQAFFCSYEEAYLPIYETSYDVSFIFCDEEEICSKDNFKEAQA